MRTWFCYFWSYYLLIVILAFAASYAVQAIEQRVYATPAKEHTNIIFECTKGYVFARTHSDFSGGSLTQFMIVDENGTVVPAQCQ